MIEAVTMFFFFIDLEEACLLTRCLEGSCVISHQREDCCCLIISAACQVNTKTFRGLEDLNVQYTHTEMVIPQYNPWSGLFTVSCVKEDGS